MESSTDMFGDRLKICTASSLSDEEVDDRDLERTRGELFSDSDWGDDDDNDNGDSLCKELDAEADSQLEEIMEETWKQLDEELQRQIDQQFQADFDKYMDDYFDNAQREEEISKLGRTMVNQNVSIWDSSHNPKDNQNMSTQPTVSEINAQIDQVIAQYRKIDFKED